MIAVELTKGTEFYCSEECLQEAGHPLEDSERVSISKKCDHCGLDVQAGAMVSTVLLDRSLNPGDLEYKVQTIADDPESTIGVNTPLNIIDYRQHDYCGGKVRLILCYQFATPASMKEYQALAARAKYSTTLARQMKEQGNLVSALQELERLRQYTNGFIDKAVEQLNQSIAAKEAFEAGSTK